MSLRGPKPAKHGRDHKKGGEDPVPFELEWAYVQAGAQLIDASAEYIVWDTPLWTNAPHVFSLATGNDGILTHEVGMYETAAFITTGAITTARDMYVQAQPLSSYPTFGTEFGMTVYALDTSLLDTTIARQNHHAYGVLGGDPDPTKVVLVARNLGSSWSTSSSGLVIIKIGGGGNVA